MIGQAIESFVERQRQEDEQFCLSMQNAITTQFSYLGNIQQAQLSMFGFVVAPTPAPIPPSISTSLEPLPQLLALIPPPPPSSPPPPTSQD
ncbi:hypothetical protein JHK82_022587 [Glycine max]|nr:hypothetical protein JHK85_023075 [Glycine max]KAG5026692.1 hypothetical protein JHK86_022606 [Glycine max]KAG5137856.1 hypothetical protein JHK82_022587 [Glycine max]